TDDGGTARDQDADLAPTGQVRITGVGAVGPDDRADDQRQNAEDQAHGHDCADDDAQLLDARQAAGVGVDVDHGSSPFREDGWFCRQVLAAATQTKECPPRSRRALRSQMDQSCWPTPSSQFIQATPAPARIAPPRETSTPTRPLVAAE